MKEKIRRAKGEKVVFTIAFIIFAIHAFTLLFSIWWGFMSSLKTQKEFSINSPLSLPSDFFGGFKNYTDAFDLLEVRGTNFFGLVGNSMYYAIGAALLRTTISMVSAYFVVRYSCWYTKFIWGWMLVDMVVTLDASSAASYKMWARIGVTDTPWILVMYIGTSVFGMLIFTGAWKGIAWDYAEAAKIDGANHVTILLKIMIPQVSGVWATLFLMDFITYWNDSSTPMMYFPNMPTLAQGLYEYEEQTTRAINMPLYFSGLMMSMVPILILFFCFSNLIMEKVYIGGLKG